MKPTNATPQIEQPGIAFGIATLSADALAADGDWPRWVKITPRGPITARDGRRFVFEPERLVARFVTDGVEVPADINHAIAKSAGSASDNGDAVGWATKLEARDDGTWALVDMLDAGRAALAKKTQRYISPTVLCNEAGLAVWLHSFSLVAAPGLAMPAIASASLTTQEQSMPKDIAKALGLAETADEAACLSAITTLTAGKVDKAVHDQALTNLAAATGRVAELEAQIATRDRADHEAKVTATLDAALKAKKIVPAQRDKYASLCATPAGLAEVQALLDVTPATLQASNLDERAAETGDVPKHEDLLAKANAEIKRAADAGLTLSLADAVMKVSGGIA
jgi:phage I-like protein